MEQELALTAWTLGITLGDFAVAYFGIVKPYHTEKRRGRVKSFGEYWSRGLESFKEAVSYSRLD